MFYCINPWFISRGETFEKFIRHPKRMLPKTNEIAIQTKPIKHRCGAFKSYNIHPIQ